MFSAALEVVLTIAYREAVSRRHAYLTLEHLLYALAHDPDGERILAACGADLPRLRRDLDAYLDESIEQLKRGDAREPEQTAAFRRVLQTAVLHVQSAQRGEVEGRRHLRRDPAAAEDPRGAAARRAGHHAARHPRVHLARHLEGAGRRRAPVRPSTAPRPAAATKARRPRAIRSPPTASNLTERARAGRARSADRPHRRAAAHDRGALPAPQEQSGVRRRGRRRQDRDGRRARRPPAGRRCAGGAEGRGDLLARHRRAARRHALPRRLRGALQGGDHGAQRAGRRRFSSSTRSTRRSAPARSPAARWIWRR